MNAEQINPKARASKHIGDEDNAPSWLVMGSQRWGRGVTLREAFKNAGGIRKGTHAVVCRVDGRAYVDDFGRMYFEHRGPVYEGTVTPNGADLDRLTVVEPEAKHIEPTNGSKQA